ncbi:hypothetical protein IQ260_27455 [Leptolyngbya cf. ectocarpi LEGE 11479]|uniref:Uncharacterized protein n=1 Tax=Leptolyngbya cf. ectocarpi LEGE 11479 TaxID=1828722 RepID=A0A929FAG1_LEPEC|nr:DUF6220 domain-containing protein [Leptolyngbya ectocarpi]MBE9070385.1 hypothetical protein [Leptolyngbya cf. ectocarpi LEGE 11479]
MTTTSETDRSFVASSWVKVGFYATSILFNICLIVQVLTVGVAYFTDPAWWTIHVWLVRGYGGLSLILLVAALMLPFSSRTRWLTASLPVLLGLQFCSIHLKTPLHLEILHPLIGFTLFYVSSSLVHRVSREYMQHGSKKGQIGVSG